MSNIKQNYTDFDEYIRQGEPSQKEKASIWQTAIGLQAVDGLQTSDYLKATACKHIEGEIDIDEARELINSYYQSKTLREPDDDEKLEADKVSANITKILSSQTLDFSMGGYISVHRRVFDGVFKHAGKLRDYDITKREWVLDGDTVNYLNWEDLRRAIDYDISHEKEFSYKGISPDAMVEHITRFVSGLWQIHAFCEGNTRTTAVFTILYLRSIGFKVDNSLFARHSWYFRNALVRANYKNALKGIDYTLYIWNVSSEICCWEINGICVTVTFTSMQQTNGKCSRILQVEQAISKRSISTGQVRGKYRTSYPRIMLISNG